MSEQEANNRLKKLKRESEIKLLATFILNVLLIFAVPSAILVLLMNTSNYWQWVVTLLLVRAYFRKDTNE